MIDRPDRPQPRFPPEREGAVTKDMTAVLDDLQAGSADLAICGGACGGDLIFAELMLGRGAHLDLYLPFEPQVFVKDSVDFANSDWHARFEAARAHEYARTFVLPEPRTDAERQASPYERNNLRMLKRALGRGAQKVHFICVWDGQAGDGPGGAGHMYEAVTAAGGVAEQPIHPLGST
ncbi:hypothetical protein [Paraburkholderia sp. 35.1]